MSFSSDTEFGRILVERKLCTTNELELVRTELEDLRKKGNRDTLPDMMVKQGYVTRSQIERLSRSMDEDSMYRPAQQIPGYQILSKLGQGAMAVVFKARQLSLDRIVAIKVLPKRLSENPEFVDRFYREGKAAAKLNHPNIVGAYDVGESGGYHYFVMEFIDGKTIYDFLEKKKPMDEKDALKVIHQCAQALDHAHAQNLIHRDVKPKNIMITNDSVVKLADMGLAREIDDHKTANAEAGRAYGTPYYISPEQIRGAIDIDFRADIYALGATFYHMVTGKVPFEGPSPSAVMHKHLKEAIVPPDHINSKLSSATGEIIEVMMAKDRDNRYLSTLDLIDDIEAALKGEPPLQARKKYDHHLLEQLASSGEVVEIERVNNSPRKISQSQQGSDKTMALGIGLFISVLINIVVIILLVK